MKIFYEIETENQRLAEQGHSFTRWGLHAFAMFFNFATSGANYASTLSFKTTAGVDFNAPYTTASTQRIFGMSHSSLIVQGTSNQAWDPLQHNLISPVTLTTVTDVTPAITYISTPIYGIQIKHETLRANGTANPIIIREIGLTGRITDTGGTERIFLVCRDALTEAVTIPSGGNIRIKYFFFLEY